MKTNKLIEFEFNNKNKKIEKNNILYNKLPIKNLAQLSYSIFQDEFCISTEKKANECLQYLTENLKKVYCFIESLDDEINLNNSQQDYFDDIDLYQIGDIINFLETIKIKKA